MVKRIEWSERAKSQLREISRYYKLNADDKVAQKIVVQIIASTRILHLNPLGAQCELLLEDRSEGFRRLISGNYKIVYFVDSDAVWIVAVFDSRRDPVKLRRSVLNREA
jgi:plasmid stabilization system protein ParE